MRPSRPWKESAHCTPSTTPTQTRPFCRSTATATPTPQESSTGGTTGRTTTGETRRPTKPIPRSKGCFASRGSCRRKCRYRCKCSRSRWQRRRHRHSGGDGGGWHPNTTRGYDHIEKQNFQKTAHSYVSSLQTACPGLFLFGTKNGTGNSHPLSSRANTHTASPSTALPRRELTMRTGATGMESPSFPCWT